MLMTLGLCATAEWATPGIAAAQAASAAAKPEAVQEIVVTGERKQETLQKAPASVTALSAQVLAEAGVKRAADFVALAPGVAIVVGSTEAADAQVNIRGLNGARDANPNFAFVVDGIVLSDPAAFNRSFTDLSQIEIFKGPQGAIYGRDAEAGAIVVTTVKPGPTFEGGTTVGYANNNTFYNQSSISGPLIKDQLFGRLSADYRTTDGFDTNTFTNSKTVDDEKAYDINGRLIWNPTSDWSFDLKASYGNVNAASINFNADFMLPGLTSVFGPAVDENVNSHQFDYVNNIVPDNHQTARELSVKFDHDMSWAKLTGYVQYSNIDNNLLSDGTVAPFGFYNNSNNITGTNVCQTSQAAALASGLKYPAPQNPALGFLGPYTASTCDGYQYQVRNEIDKSAELRLSSTNNNGLAWSGGVYYLNVDRHVGVSIGNDLGLPILQNLYNPANSQSPTSQEYNDAFTTNVYAAFGSIDYNILSNLVLSAAIRYDVEQRSVHNEVPAGNLQDYINVVAGGPANGVFYPLNPGLIVNPSGIPDAHKTFSQPEPRVSLRWDVQPNISLYSTIGVGFKSGGFNSSGTEATIKNIAAETGSDVKVGDSYAKETSTAYEIGMKGNFLDRKLGVQVAFYYTQVNNMQFAEFFSTPQGLLRTDSNIARVNLDGVEIGLQYKLKSWLSAVGGFNYTDSKILANESRPDTVGNQSPYTPQYTANIGLSLNKPITDDVKLIGRLDTNFTGPTWFHTVQDQTVPSLFGPADLSKGLRAAYSLTNLRFGVATGKVELVAFVSNVFDKRYLAEVIPAPEFGGAFVSEGPGRLVGAEVSYRF